MPLGVVATGLVVTSFFSSAGCHFVRDDAETLLGRARYPDALERLVDEEADAAHYGRRERVRYALLRGLTHLALGDGPAADRWLGEAKRTYDRDPHCLPEDQGGRLLDAWASLGHGL